MTFGRTIGYEVNVMDWLNQILFPIMDEMDEAALIQEATERALSCARRAGLDHRLNPLYG
jgi:hypothetical protein